MHTASARSDRDALLYRERLAPSLWTLVAAAVVAPMASLVFVRIDAAFSLALGLAAAVGVIALLIGLAPTVEVSGTILRAGRARIDVSLLADPVVLEEDGARTARGPGLDTSGWHLIRGGIDGIVRIAVTDQDDPTTTWTISSRTPHRLAAAVAFAQSAREDAAPGGND